MSSCSTTRADGWTTGGDLIKRVVGLPGDTVEARGTSLIVNGETVADPWRREGAPAASKDFTMKVAPGQLLVLGDNRGESADSSYHGETVPQSSVIGRAVLVVWPLNRLGSL